MRTLELDSNCPICSDALIKVNERMSVFYCNNCTHSTSLLSKNEQEPYEEDYFIKTHSRWFDNPDFGLFDTVLKLVRDTIGKKDQFSILDIGCGTGNFLKHINSKSKNLNLTGIDLIANEHDTIKFIKGDFFETPIKKRFDVVTNFAVIEHVENPSEFVARMKELLAVDGIMVINTVNSNSLTYRIARLFNKIGFTTPYVRLYDPHHLQHFNNTSLIKLLENFDLKIVKVKNHNTKLKAVDVPTTNPILQKIFLFFVGVMFFISEPMNQGILQTIYCQKKN